MTMAILQYETSNYMSHSHKGGGASITRKHDYSSVFFQPGDDANAWLDAIAALDELPIHKQDMIFDMLCSDYTDVMA